MTPFKAEPFLWLGKSKTLEGLRGPQVRPGVPLASRKNANWEAQPLETESKPQLKPAGSKDLSPMGARK